MIMMSSGEDPCKVDNVIDDNHQHARSFIPNTVTKISNSQDQLQAISSTSSYSCQRYLLQCLRGFTITSIFIFILLSLLITGGDDDATINIQSWFGSSGSITTVTTSTNDWSTQFTDDRESSSTVQTIEAVANLSFADDDQQNEWLMFQSTDFQNSTYESSSTTQYGWNLIDWSDCIFSERYCHNYQPVVIESKKLIFFTIPKNSSSEWKKLFRRILNYDDWATLSPHDPSTNGLQYLSMYSQSAQYQMMTSPDWTRAIIVRDPMERLLSAYLNKGLSHERYIKKICCNIYPRKTEQARQNEIIKLKKQHRGYCLPLTPFETLPTSKTFPFETFVENFMYQCNDVHWRPQSVRIKPDNWKFINFIGYFDNLQEDARKLLEKIDAYDQYGASGWGPNGNMSLFERERVEGAHQGPVTHSHERMKQFYTPTIKRKVLQYLRKDYENPWLNLTKPVGYYKILNGLSKKDASRQKASKNTGKTENN